MIDDENLARLRDMIPMIATLGIELVAARPDLVQARMSWAPELCTAAGVLHGGALMSLADTTGAVCAYLNLPPAASATTTIESKTNFLRAVTHGTVHASSTPLHRGRRLAVIETELRDGNAHLVAKVTQTQIYRE